MSVVVAAVLTAAVLVWPDRTRVLTMSLQGVFGQRRQRRNSVAAVEIASAMELLALVLQSGTGVVEALEIVGRELQDALGSHLLTVAAALRWGVAEDEAWACVPGAWSPVAQAMLLAARAGAPPADMLVRAATDVRHAERHRLEAATARLGVTVVLPLGLAFLPGFILTTVVPVVIALTSSVLGG